MKKRMLSLFLALCMLCSLVTVSASAADTSGDFEIEDGILKKYTGGGGEVIIPDEVTSIGEEAFKDCTGLTGVTIPDSVTSIGMSAFASTSLTSIAIPNGVTSIGIYAFNNCANLSEVTIPNSVTSIGEATFLNCTSLDSVTIPNSVTAIGWRAFDGCKSLTSVTIPDSVTSIDWCAFQSCTGLTSITIPDSVTNIGNAAFADTGLTSVTIPNSVTSIGEGVFENCTSLTSVTISASVTDMGYGSFSGCTSLTNINVDTGNMKYASEEDVLFTADKKTLLLCPNGKVGTYAIPDGVTSIEGSAFSGCTNLTSITIPGSVTSIGGSAFRGCTGLTDITIPDGVTTIGTRAFVNDNLTSVTLSKNVSKFVGGGDNAFSGCTSLTAIQVDLDNPNYISIDGVLFNSAKDTLVMYPSGKQGPYVIPDGVTSIQDGAFAVCAGLTSVTFPSGASVGDRAFEHCETLASVVVPLNVTIPKHFFMECHNLTDVYFEGTEEEWKELGIADGGRYTVHYNTAIHTHSYGPDWQSDENNHWHECSCGDRADTAAHTRDSGTVTTAPTADSAGVRTFKCSVCGYNMGTESIPATGGGSETPEPDPTPSDGGGTGGGSSTPVATPEVTTENGNTTVNQTVARPTVNASTGTASSTVSSSIVNRAIASAVKNDAANVTLTVPKATGSSADKVTNVELKVSASSMKNLASQSKSDLTVASQVAEVTIPNGVVAQLGEGRGQVTVSAKTDTDEATGTITVEVELKQDGRSVEANGVTATVPASTVQTAAGKEEAAVVVKTPTAEVTLPNQALNDLDSKKPISVQAAVDTDKGEVTITLKQGDQSIERMSGGFTVATGVSEDHAKSGEDLVAYDENGKIIPTSILKGTQMRVALNGSSKITYQPNPKTFPDAIPDWAEKGAKFTTSRELIRGIGTGEEAVFGADSTMTKAMIVTILQRLDNGGRESGSHTFSDVSGDSWYAESASWAVENNIVDSSSSFHDTEITREDLAVMLYKYVDNGKKTGTSDKNYSDMNGVSEVSPSAEDAVKWAVESGIIQGDDNNNLNAQKLVSRGEVSEMLVRFVGVVVG